MRRKSTVLILAILGLSLATVYANEDVKDGSSAEQHPAPEPYSFSFSSESLGGMTTREETGDANGRVTGFYMMMGDDGRERRVDYVADENGYRASISTNEVGTRSESSADAQYNARLPTDQQLVQAKVTAEEYKFLEDTHQAERERHLSQVSGNRLIQQQQQQPTRINLGNFESSTSIPLQTQLKQQQQSRFVQNDSNSISNSNNNRWNTNYNRNNIQESIVTPSSRPLIQQQQQQSQSPTRIPMLQVELNKPSEAPSSSFDSTSTYDSSADDWRFRAANNDNKTVIGQTVGISTEAKSVQQSWQQQQQQQPIEKTTQSSPLVQNLGLQKQIEQQFMLQATALTNQDYPRQSSQLMRPINRPESVVVAQNNNNNNQLLRQQQQQQDYSQTSQQQNNIIEEVANQGEQVVDQEIQTNQQQQQQQPQVVKTVPLAPPTTTTSTTIRPTPSGFIAINLQENQQEDGVQEVQVPDTTPQTIIQQVQQQQQQPQQQQQLQQQNQIVYKDEEVQTNLAPQTGLIQQQVVVQQQQPAFVRPDSIKQVIENINRPLVQQQQQQQQQQQKMSVKYDTKQFQPMRTTTTPVVVTTNTPTARPIFTLPQTTTPYVPTITTTTTTSTTTTPAPVFAPEPTTTTLAPIKSVQQPVVEEPITTTTTTQRPVIVISQKQPQQQQQQQQQQKYDSFLVPSNAPNSRRPIGTKLNVSGIKGYQQQQQPQAFARLPVRNLTTITNQQPSWMAMLTSSISEGRVQAQKVVTSPVVITSTPAETLVTSEPAISQENSKTELSRQVVPIVPMQKVQTSITSSNYAIQQQPVNNVSNQQQQLFRQTTTTNRPVSQQQWASGTKGGSKLGAGVKKQFWQTQSQQAPQQLQQQQQQQQQPQAKQPTGVDYAGPNFGQRIG